MSDRGQVAAGPEGEVERPEPLLGQCGERLLPGGCSALAQHLPDLARPVVVGLGPGPVRPGALDPDPDRRAGVPDHAGPVISPGIGGLGPGPEVEPTDQRGVGRELDLDVVQVEDLALGHAVSILEMLLEGAPSGLGLDSLLGQLVPRRDLLRVGGGTSGERHGAGCRAASVARRAAVRGGDPRR